MSGFAIASGVAATVGLAAGIGGTMAAPTKAELGSHEGIDRREFQNATLFGIPGAMAAGFLGMTTDTPALFVGASALVGLAAGGIIGNVFAGIGDARDAVGR